MKCKVVKWKDKKRKDKKRNEQKRKEKRKEKKQNGRKKSGMMELSNIQIECAAKVGSNHRTPKQQDVTKDIEKNEIR